MTNINMNRYITVLVLVAMTIAVITIMTPEPPTSFELQLTEGWQLISIPLVQNDTDILDVLESIDGKWDLAQWFNTSSALWKDYIVGRPPFLQTLWNLNWTMGFWIHITENCTLTGNGTVATEGIGLYPDSTWHTVGFPMQVFGTYTVADARRDTSALSVRGQNETGLVEIGELEDSHVLQHGTGYWFNVTENTTWYGPWIPFDWEAAIIAMVGALIVIGISFEVITSISEEVTGVKKFTWGF